MVPIFIRTFYPQTFCSPNISIALSWKVESSECFALDTFLSARQSSCSLITINFLFFILSDGSGTKFELFPRRLAIGMPPQWNEWKENEIFWSAGPVFSTLISKSPWWNFDKVGISGLGRAIRNVFPFLFRRKSFPHGFLSGSISDRKHEWGAQRHDIWITSYFVLFCALLIFSIFLMTDFRMRCNAFVSNGFAVFAE